MKKQFGLAVCILLAAIAYLKVFTTIEAVPLPADIEGFPKQIASFTMTGSSDFSDKVLQELGVSSYINRDYRDKEGHQLSLYLGYYEEQREGSMIHTLLGLAWFSGMLDWYAIWRKNKKLEVVSKPLTIFFLLLWVFVFGFQEAILDTNLLFFIIALGFCLAGDIFLLLPPERFFIHGLSAFLIGHLWYILGFGGFERSPKYLVPILIYFFVIIVVGYQVVGRLIYGLREKKKEHLTAPIIIYSIVITVMLGSSGYRFFDSDWTTAGAYLTGIGALFFYISDVLNAWERFVNKFRNDRLIIMVTYHLGQFGLAVGAALHFANKLPG